MQACEAYYSDGRFIPLGIGRLPEGTKAIITLLNEAPKDVGKSLKEFDALVELIHAAAEEDMPPIEPIRLREVEL